MTTILNIANDFSPTPGARYRTDGKFSGQEFYESILNKAFSKTSSIGQKLVIVLDGTAGYATSFLDEAFGRLARDFGVEKVKSGLSLVSVEEPELLEEIDEYIENAHSMT